MLNAIDERDLPHPGRKYLLTLFNEFMVSGPNGDHRVLASGCLGPSVSDVRACYTCDLLLLDVARKVTVQSALSVANIYSCGIIHGGETILFQQSRLSRITEACYSRLPHQKYSNKTPPH